MANKLSSDGIICLTPIVPHRPKIHPIVLSEDHWITITGNELGKRPLRAVVDGRGYQYVENILVRKSEETLNVLYFKEHNFLRNVLQFF